MLAHTRRVPFKSTPYPIFLVNVRHNHPHTTTTPTKTQNWLLDLNTNKCKVMKMKEDREDCTGWREHSVTQVQPRATTPGPAREPHIHMITSATNSTLAKITTPPRGLTQKELRPLHTTYMRPFLPSAIPPKKELKHVQRSQNSKGYSMNKLWKFYLTLLEMRRDSRETW